MNRIIFLSTIFLAAALTGLCSIYLSQITMGQESDPIKTARVLLQDANDTLKTSNDTSKAIARLDLALGRLDNKTNYNNSSSIQTAAVLIGDAIQALRDHDIQKGLLRLNLANQELAAVHNFKIIQLKTNTKNSTMAGENTNVTKGQVPYRQATDQAHSSDNFLTYKNSTFSYSIEYPFDWRILHIESQPSTTYIPALYRNVVVFINVNSSIDQNLTTEDVGNKIVEVSSRSLYAKDFRLIDRNANDYFVAGHHAARVEFTVKHFNPVTGETQQRIVSLASIIDGKGYEIVTSAPDSKFSDYATLFEHMISSFRLNG